MHSFTLITTAIVSSVLYSSFIYANDIPTIDNNTQQEVLNRPASADPKLKDLKNIKIDDLKVNAKADQPDSIKDPLQPLNRKVFAFNDYLDRNVARPLAVQYVTKVPQPARNGYRAFKENLVEPRNAVYQLIQARPLRATQTLGRFAINTVTTLGFVDIAQHFGLTLEDEDFGQTLGYYGIPSGPYIVLPVFGPNTFRSTFGIGVDSQGRLQKYILKEHSLYWSEQFLRGLDTRAQILDYDSVLTGDKYAQIRDIYLQRTEFTIAEKRGLESENLFIEDNFDEFDNNDDISDE